MPSRPAACLDLLPTEILAKVLALASCEESPFSMNVGPPINPQAVGQLMVCCKRFSAALHSAAFWQETWVLLETTTLYDPCHAQWLTRLAVDLTSLAPPLSAYCKDNPVIGRDFSYQPLMPCLQHLDVSILPPSMCLVLCSLPQTQRQQHS